MILEEMFCYSENFGQVGFFFLYYLPDEDGGVDIPVGCVVI
jgi:hypothetical protein